MKTIALKDRIIFALDVDSGKEALNWVKRLQNHVHFYKVGLQLFLAEGFNVIDAILDKGHQVMLDLKLYDIPETVKLAVSQIRRHAVTFTTVHGNDSILEAAAKVKGDVNILAVTVLTSMAKEDLAGMSQVNSVEDLVSMRAKNAIQAGCDGVVCSGREAARLRRELGQDFYIVTPGIRPAQNGIHDQQRVMTPKDAIENGADYLVVGRPIRDAKDPIKVVESMQAQIDSLIQ